MTNIILTELDEIMEKNVETQDFVSLQKRQSARGEDSQGEPLFLNWTLILL